MTGDVWISEFLSYEEATKEALLADAAEFVRRQAWRSGFAARERDCENEVNALKRVIVEPVLEHMYYELRQALRQRWTKPIIDKIASMIETSLETAAVPERMARKVTVHFSLPPFSYSALVHQW